MPRAVVVDMTIYVISPSRRGSASALHLMLTHALGEAGAPYLVAAPSLHRRSASCLTA